eukprot:CAMPEP_0184389406 /NCGR_PEP_ID=MMETSP0007-20130409/12455_1 /TAXON_ID=97485 /ORGANISM="Prymnesium parvum, Strain Texoma1" /LENGTH=120 /DNA_ID=CAMNT_0026738715 /DNA_START=281 /DNA_END=643 /DNA_ORIENTATION=-
MTCFNSAHASSRFSRAGSKLGVLGTSPTWKGVRAEKSLASLANAAASAARSAACSRSLTSTKVSPSSGATRASSAGSPSTRSIRESGLSAVVPSCCRTTRTVLLHTLIEDDLSNSAFWVA